MLYRPLEDVSLSYKERASFLVVRSSVLGFPIPENRLRSPSSRVTFAWRKSAQKSPLFARKNSNCQVAADAMVALPLREAYNSGRFAQSEESHGHGTTSSWFEELGIAEVPRAVEFFDLVLARKRTEPEQTDLVAC